MTVIWDRSDLDKLNSFSSADFRDWIRCGLTDWDNPQDTWQAFAPVADRFELRDDPEPQLAAMFKSDEMSERMRQTFLNAIRLGLSEAEASDGGYAFFDALQRLSILIGRPEPVAA